MGIDLDNDLFITSDPWKRTDYEYTHGARLWGEWSGANGPLPQFTDRLLDCEAATFGCTTRLEIGQEVYTPRRRSTNGPMAGHRPHAGWLYASVTTSRHERDGATTYGMEVGVLGPPAMARELQEAVHTLFAFPEPVGWEHQLPFEPGLQVRVEHSRTPVSWSWRGLSAAGTLGGRLDVGNILTRARGHVRAQVCIGAGSCGMWQRGGGDEPFAVMLRAEVAPGMVARNAFLEGPLFSESHRVDPNVLVIEHAVEVELRVKGISIAYGLRGRGPEYRTEPGAFKYGSVRLGYHR